MRERQVIYATSIPGETDWHKLRSARSQTSSAGDADALAGELASRLQVGQNASSSSSSNNTLASKFPLPGVPHTSALVKTYPTTATGASSEFNTDTVKVTEIVDFIGVVDYSSFPSSSSLEESPSSTNASTSQLPEQIKTLHAIYRLPTSKYTRSEASPEQIASTRQELIDVLSTVLEGDKLAAEWLLVSLLGKIHTRRGALALGQLPINLVLPLTMVNSEILIKNLQDLLEKLLPRIVKLDFHVSELNKVKYLPESRDENLISGVLQLPESTVVLVDETRMGEGNLQDRGKYFYLHVSARLASYRPFYLPGVKNMQALASVLQEQTLAYVFPFSSFTFETDLTMIVISKGKSLLPVGSLPVRVNSRMKVLTSLISARLHHTCPPIKCFFTCPFYAFPVPTCQLA